ARHAPAVPARLPGPGERGEHVGAALPEHVEEVRLAADVLDLLRDASRRRVAVEARAPLGDRLLHPLDRARRLGELRALRGVRDVVAVADLAAALEGHGAVEAVLLLEELGQRQRLEG